MNETIKKLMQRHKSVAKTDDEVKNLDALYNEFEKALEDAGQKHQYNQQATALLAERANEIRSIRTARKCILWLSAILSVFVILAFYVTLFFILCCPISAQHVVNMPDAAKVAFISVSFISSFGLIAIIVKGLLKPQDKEESNILPTEHMKMMWEVLKESATK